MTCQEALEVIARLLGQEWNQDTCADIQDVVEAMGLTVPDDES